MSVSQIPGKKKHQKHILFALLNGEKPIDPSCRSRQLLSHITSRWGVLTLIALQRGTLRFGEMRQLLNGVSERMLIKVLKDFEKDGLVLRKSFPVIPPHTEYSLTPAGLQAADLVTQLTDWVSNYQSAREP
ncbi:MULTISPECIES: winged helix-turn-helix transcriptional regulator [Tenebrionibacter/Tenebrionicola group]|jgi:DNA-binding HxlR family transcriptional regulator|uniref:Helix-turn-helix transcriptional regulator n=2 Tax=Tenebrionibacter/Tenebrionicola group TaxID=2969848 RepID=A0A8K0V675_9ENTR|nr:MULTISPECIES: helix-turn-helix domain-containing protein [Tenebrionibacter/Tenebrionicola group]MBK4715739.1 helix-turn-helix transcriptional regulator [Tenebrionibacter intestinalis]MBV4413900.1 helix-turn-helix transcriptional regulator [Tenebrionicola larvae]MBV5096319.1 helix-turn-helix transcriptional regulator [Tenebrionicola larvae]